MGIKVEHVQRFRAITRSLNMLMQEITAYNPEAEIYVSGCFNFNLMKGPTHDPTTGQPLFDNVVQHSHVFRASGGAW